VCGIYCHVFPISKLILSGDKLLIISIVSSRNVAGLVEVCGLLVLACFVGLGISSRSLLHDFRNGA
jgi:hypothetical protein